MKREWMGKVGVLVAGLLCTGLAAAERYSFVGHRSQGMGGANAASVNDASAQWHNPAAFGFFNREADEIPGLQTNIVSNLVVNVEEVAITNEVPTNIVEIVSVTNEIPKEVVEAGTSGGSVTNTVMESEVVSQSVTNEVMTNIVMMASVTNEYYTYTNEVVDIKVVPDRARVDNMKLEQHDWGWNILGLGVGYTMTEDMPEYVTQLGLIDYDFVNGDGLDGSIENIESSLALGSALYGLGSNPDNAFYVDATAGMNFRFGRWGIGVRMFGEVAGFVDYLDTTNLGIEQTEGEFIDAVNNAAGLDGFNPVGYTYQSINPGDLNISGTLDGDNAEAYIDYQLTQLKSDGVLNDQNIDDAVIMANLVTYGVPITDPTSFENNQSTVTARGFGLFEVPVSFGYAFNDNLSVGITAKGMYGTVTGTKVLFTEEDSFESAVDNLKKTRKPPLTWASTSGCCIA